MMTKNNIEVSQSVGDDDYLQRFPNGTAGQPSNGFQEGPLGYNWPGKVTTSVREALVDGRRLLSPAGGDRFNVKGFTRTQQRCPGDAQVVYPRVLKPAPELDRLARPRLHAAADAAKTLRAHYRFSDYSDGAWPPTRTVQLPSRVRRQW